MIHLISSSSSFTKTNLIANNNEIIAKNKKLFIKTN